MANFIKDFDIICVTSGPSTAHATIKRRPSHAFYYKVNGESIYTFGEKNMHINAGTVLYIPAGETYTFRKTSEGDSNYILINFLSDLPFESTPHLFNFSNEEDVYSLFKKMDKCFSFSENTVNKYELMSLFFLLLSAIEKNRQSTYTTSEQKAKIEPAIEYLETHLFDSGLKISSLHKFCNISAPTFRRIFISRFGVSPKKYIINLRMSRAKAIIESGEYNNISEVAKMVGYDDPLYFSKHFKSFYATSPSKWS